MKELFCNYEIALKLKELGFDKDCFASICKSHPDELIPCRSYPKEGNEDTHFSTINNLTLSDMWVATPLWQQVQSFLDDNKVIIDIIFVDNVFKYTLNIENYVSNGFKNRMSAIKSATEHATSYLWNKKFGI